jgi:hypothetical protein
MSIGGLKFQGPVAQIEGGIFHIGSLPLIGSLPFITITIIPSTNKPLMIMQKYAIGYPLIRPNTHAHMRHKLAIGLPIHLNLICTKINSCFNNSPKSDNMARGFPMWLGNLLLFGVPFVLLCCQNMTRHWWGQKAELIDISLSLQEGMIVFNSLSGLQKSFRVSRGEGEPF